MKVCFVGVGSIAKRHMRNLFEICQHDGIPLQVDALRRTDEAADYVTNVYTKTEDMPDDYDVVFLTNPTEYHAKMLLELHEKAKHFFIEKPVTSWNTMSMLEGFHFREESVYYVACPLRYNSVIQYIRSNIHLDKVISVRCISSSFLPDWRPGVDYRNTYSAKKALGGGVGTDLIHEWDYLTYLFGFPNDVKMLSGKISDLDIDSDDFAIYIARYDRMIAEIHLDYFGRKSIRRIEMIMDNETIVGDLISNRIDFLVSGKHVDLSENRDVYQKRELRRFMELTSGEKDRSADVNHAIRVLKISQGEE